VKQAAKRRGIQAANEARDERTALGRMSEGVTARPTYLGLCVLALTIVTCGSTASAQSWPARPIRYLVPFPPGGGTDTSARLMAPSLSSELGQQVVVENRPGAGGMIGVEQAAKAAPDGYTMVQATVGQVSINPNLLRKLSFDPA
jgi:tripartite-type tricarboxylate transporter receptor subunit TctC